MNAFLAKVGIFLAILIGTSSAVWFKASEHYKTQYEALKSGYETAARLQKAEVDKTIADQEAQTKRVNDEAQKQIGNMAGTIATLRLRVNSSRSAVALCPSASSTGVPAEHANGSGAAAGSGQSDATAGSGVQASIDLGILASALDTGIGALKAEILWRDYARSTKQFQ